MPKGSDLLVAALENEGVDRIFGVPGEENLDVVESLRNSSIRLILTRHEQGAAFMAATYGRLTGKPGVCITTLGRCPEPHDRSSLRSAWGHAHDHADGAKGHHEQPPGKIPDRRCRQCVQTAHQAFPADRQHQQHSDPGSRRLSNRDGRAAARCCWSCRRTSPASKPKISRWYSSTRSRFRSPTVPRWIVLPK